MLWPEKAQHFDLFLFLFLFFCGIRAQNDSIMRKQKTNYEKIGLDLSNMCK